MAILVVGDRKVIEPGLRSLDAVGTTITFVDMEGKPWRSGLATGATLGNRNSAIQLCRGIVKPRGFAA